LKRDYTGDIAHKLNKVGMDQQLYVPEVVYQIGHGKFSF